MQMAVIIDVVLAAVLIVCTVLGWRRGAFKSVIGIVVVLAISIDSVTTILAESRRRKAYLAKHRAQIQEVIHK